MSNKLLNFLKSNLTEVLHEEIITELGYADYMPITIDAPEFFGHISTIEDNLILTTQGEQSVELRNVKDISKLLIILRELEGLKTK